VEIQYSARHQKIIKILKKTKTKKPIRSKCGPSPVT